MIMDRNNSLKKFSSIIYSLSVMKSVSNNFTNKFIDGQSTQKNKKNFTQFILLVFSLLNITYH